MREILIKSSNLDFKPRTIEWRPLHSANGIIWPFNVSSPSFEGLRIHIKKDTQMPFPFLR